MRRIATTIALAGAVLALAVASPAGGEGEAEAALRRAVALAKEPPGNLGRVGEA